MAYLNGSQAGYEKGFEDGRAGRKKNAVGIVSALSHALRPGNYTDTFIEGYNRGWIDGNRKRNRV